MLLNLTFSNSNKPTYPADVCKPVCHVDFCKPFVMVIFVTLSLSTTGNR